MKLIGWALALSAAAMTPASLAAQETAPAAEAETTVQLPGPGEADVSDVAAEAAASDFEYTPAVESVGQPDGRMGIQDQYTELGQRAADFHDYWLLTLCVVISVFVLGLLLWTLVRYNRRANPTPSRNSHNTALEVIWTLVPVLILVAIAIPSIRLLAAQYSPPPADITIKVVGHQWYWTYEYPDHGGIELVSNMLKEEDDPTRGEGQRARTDADGPPLLAVDERLVIPAGKTVKFIITANDVIHSFAIPAFWTKMDAVPGRLNEDWVKVDKPGVYFGQCSELCGARHGYMPIAVEVVPEAKFAAWVASKGGTMPGTGSDLAEEDAESAEEAAEAGDAAGAEEAEAAEAAATN